MAGYYGEQIHYKYLYYLGLIECDKVTIPMSQSEFINNQIGVYVNEIEEFFRFRNQGNIHSFIEEIIRDFKNRLDGNNTPKSSILCEFRKMTTDNYVFLLNLLSMAGFLVYKLSKYLMGLVFNRHFKTFYHQIKDRISRNSMICNWNILDLVNDRFIRMYKSHKDIKFSNLLKGPKEKAANIFEYMKSFYNPRMRPKQPDDSNLNQRTEELLALMVNKIKEFSETIEELKHAKHLGDCS